MDTKPYVQMPRDNEAEKLLAQLVDAVKPNIIVGIFPELDKAYHAAEKYLFGNKVLSEAHV